MNDLLTINYDSGQPTVSARDLHENVGSTERFSTWFERQLQLGFEVEEDYTSVKVLTEVHNNGGVQKRELQDYNLTVDMAKQICMVQKNERAKKIRQGLIDLEKAWNTPEQIMARALKMADQKIHSLQIDVKRMKPKEIFADAVSASNHSILIGDLAKMIKQNGVDIGQQRLFEWIRYNGYLIKRKGADWNSPTQRSMDIGLFEIKETAIHHSDGHVTLNKTTKVTGKGQQYFINKFLNNEVCV